MRLASSVVGLSFSAALCASARAETAPLAAPETANAEQAVGVRNLGGSNREIPSSGERPDWMYAEGRWDAFRGSDHHPISEEAFYRIVGRDDLLRRYRREAVVRKSLKIAGGALIFGGLLFAVLDWQYRNQPNQNLYIGGASPPAPGVSPAWGLAAVGTGLVSLIVGHYLDPTPVDASEADSLARDYDRSLGSNLGISDTPARRERRALGEIGR